LKQDLNNILAKHTGQPVEKVEQDTDRDYYMTSSQALEYGIIDEIIVKRTSDSKKRGTSHGKKG